MALAGRLSDDVNALKNETAQMTQLGKVRELTVAPAIQRVPSGTVSLWWFSKMGCDASVLDVWRSVCAIRSA